MHWPNLGNFNIRIIFILCMSVTIIIIFHDIYVSWYFFVNICTISPRAIWFLLYWSCSIARVNIAGQMSSRSRFNDVNIDTFENTAGAVLYIGAQSIRDLAYIGKYSVVPNWLRAFDNSLDNAVSGCYVIKLWGCHRVACTRCTFLPAHLSKKISLHVEGIRLRSGCAHGIR